MSWCAEWIRDWLREKEESQSAFARRHGVGPDNVSRWLSGTSRPDREAVSRLVSRLDEADAAGLLVAWLKDCLPEGTERLVRVERAVADWEGDFTLRDDVVEYKTRQPHFPPGMSVELRERLVFFGQLALDNPGIRKIVEVCYQAAMRGMTGGRAG